MPIIPRFPPNLPPDTLGWVASPHYQSPLLAGTDNKQATGGSVSSPLGCSYEALSTFEKRGVRIAHLNPNVLDVRTQVPMRTSTEFADLVRRYEGRVPAPRPLAQIDANIALAGGVAGQGRRQLQRLPPPQLWSCRTRGVFGRSIAGFPRP